MFLGTRRGACYGGACSLPHTLASFPVCGNGGVDFNEECDCGLVYDDSCDCQNCVLKDGKVKNVFFLIIYLLVSSQPEFFLFAFKNKFEPSEIWTWTFLSFCQKWGSQSQLAKLVQNVFFNENLCT